MAVLDRNGNPISTGSGGTVQGRSSGGSSSVSRTSSSTPASSSNNFMDMYNNLISRPSSGNGYYTSADIAKAGGYIGDSNGGGAPVTAPIQLEGSNGDSLTLAGLLKEASNAVSDVLNSKGFISFDEARNINFDTVYSALLDNIETNKGYYTSEDIDKAYDLALDSLDYSASQVSIQKDYSKAAEEVSFSDVYNQMLSEQQGDKEYFTSSDIDTAYKKALEYTGTTEANDILTGISDKSYEGATTEVDFMDVYRGMLANEQGIGSDAEFFTPEDVQKAYESASSSLGADSVFINKADQSALEAEATKSMQDYAGEVVSDAYKLAGIEDFVDPEALSDWSQYLVDSNMDEGLFDSSFLASVDYRSAAEKLAAEQGTDLSNEKLDIVEVGSIADKGLFKWATDFITGEDESDMAKTFAVEDLEPIVAGTAYNISQVPSEFSPQGTQDQLNIVQSAGVEQDIATLLDFSGFNEALDVEDIKDTFTNEQIQERFDLTNSTGFSEFANVYSTVQEAGSSWGGIFGMQPDVIVKDGLMYAEDNVSLTGLIGNAVDYLSGKFIGSAAANIVGDVAYAISEDAMKAAYGAVGTQAVLAAIDPVDIKAYVGEDGRAYTNISFFGNESFVAVEDMFNNTQQATEATQSMIADTNSGYNLQSSLATGIGNSSYTSTIGTDTAPEADATTGSSRSWKDIYDPWGGWTTKDIIAEVAANGLNVAGETLQQLSPEAYNAAQLAARIDSGEDLVSATVGVYGDQIADFMPEGYEKPTEAAIRMAAGENRVEVLGDIYGEDVGLDNPLGQAALSSAATYDKTGDEGQALQDGVVTYFKEGGKLPELEVPEFLGDVDFNLDYDLLGDINLDVDLSLPEWLTDIEINTDIFDGINFGDIKTDWNIELPELADLNIDIPKLDFSGMSFGDLNMDLPSLADLDINLPDIDFKGVDFGDLNISLPELEGLDVNIPDINFDGFDIADLGGDYSIFDLEELGIDWEGMNFGDIPLPELIAMGGYNKDSKLDDEDYVDPFADTTKEEETPKKTPLSQLILKSAQVA